jgi:cephalosporin hydroxylase
MNLVEAYKAQCKKRIDLQGKNEKLLAVSSSFIEETIRSGYSYNFTWMGRPIIQYPQDMIAMQEIIWELKPDLIVETGIAHGGSIIY